MAYIYYRIFRKGAMEGGPGGGVVIFDTQRGKLVESFLWKTSIRPNVKRKMNTIMVASHT